MVDQKRIVFFVGALCQGGAERVISILSGKMAEENIPVEILLYYDRESFYDIHPDVRVVRVERETGSRNLLRNLFWIRKHFINNARIVCSFLAVFNMIALAAAFFTHVPVIVADRNDPRFIPGNRVVRLIRDVLYRFADHVVLQTKHNQDYFSPQIRNKSTIIFNPINLGENAGAALRTEKRKEIVSVGRLMPSKNHKLLIDAFALIHKKYPEHQLVIYGEGPLRPEYEKQIRDLGLEGFVHIPGSFKDLHSRIAGAELFVLSSDYEGMSNALMEAMCLGLPVVSTEVSGAPDLIVPGENGVLVPCNDVTAMAEAVSKMLGDAAFRESCAANAVQLNEKLAADSICREWIRCIESLDV